MGYNTDDPPERARRALASIHEARENVDAAADQYMDVFYSSEQGDEQRERAHMEFHKAVIRLYNRLRPYIYEADIQDRVIRNTGGNSAIMLRTLDKWRRPSGTRTIEKERVGERNRTVQKDEPLVLPVDLCFEVMDELNRAIVELEFGAEPGEEVQKANVEEPDLEQEKPEFDSEPEEGTA